MNNIHRFKKTNEKYQHLDNPEKDLLLGLGKEREPIEDEVVKSS